MEKILAENLMKSLLDLDVSVNAIASQIESIEDVEGKKLMRRGLARVMANIYVDLMCPIIREYKYLDPHK